jgi:hypothetical protein
MVTVWLRSDDEDKQRKFDLAENGHQIPPGDPDFETLYRCRNDAENLAVVAPGWLGTDLANSRTSHLRVGGQVVTGVSEGRTALAATIWSTIALASPALPWMRPEACTRSQGNPQNQRPSTSEAPPLWTGMP